jgi:diguanylate cyclase (GGDEF)-like protein
LLRVMERQNFDVAELARVVGADQGLAAKLVRLANLTLQEQKREAANVGQALMLLGAPSVCQLALVLSLTREVRRNERAGFDHDWFWRRSLLAGVALRALARVQALGRLDEGFVAAYLQDFGMLALLATAPDVYGDVVSRGRADHDRLIALERTEVGATHPETTIWLLSRWRLPVSVLELAVYAHVEEAQISSKRVDERVARAIALSGPIADLLLAIDPAQAANAASAQLGGGGAPTATAFADVLDQVVGVADEMASIFDVALPRSDELAGRAAAAKQLLTPGAAMPVVRRSRTGSAEVVLDEAAKDALIVRYDNAQVEEVLGRALDEAERGGKPLSLTVCDVDNLGSLNAQIGREASDRLLKSVGQFLRIRLRGRDLAARFDGGGFLLVLVDTPAQGAEIVAERIRREIEETEFEVGIGRPLKITTSIGCAAREDGMSARELVASAVMALRMAKTGGRNRVARSGQQERRAAP